MGASGLEFNPDEDSANEATHATSVEPGSTDWTGGHGQSARSRRGGEIKRVSCGMTVVTVQ